MKHTLCLYPHHQALHDSYYILHHKYFRSMECTEYATKLFLLETKHISCV